MYNCYNHIKVRRDYCVKYIFFTGFPGFIVRSLVTHLKTMMRKQNMKQKCSSGDYRGTFKNG